MMHQVDLQSTTDKLRHALAHKALPDDLVETGNHLLAGLQRPAQIIVLGLPGSGKTSLINVILRNVDLPALKSVPIFEIVYGSKKRFRCTNGNSEECNGDGIVTQDAISNETVRVIQELPLPHLKSTRLAEINLKAPLDIRAKVLDWALHYADVAIWCSQNFDDREAAIWQEVPDRLKDNSFLALTKADQLQMKGTLSQQTAHFEDNYADEFYRMVPVATKHATAACADGAVADHDLWRASGCEVFSKALDRLVASGKLADADYADMLLARATALPDMATLSSTANNTHLDATMDAASDHAETFDATAGTSGIAADGTHMELSEAIETALSMIQTCADDLVAAPNPRNNVTYILNHCAETAQALSTLLMDTAPDDKNIIRLRDDALESEQMIQLFQLERNETAAADAVTLLLQLKKEMAQVVN